MLKYLNDSNSLKSLNKSKLKSIETSIGDRNLNEKQK